MRRSVTALLQDKEMTVRHDCDQVNVFLQNISSPVVFIIFIIIYIFKRDLNYIHYMQCLTNLLKQMMKGLCRCCSKLTALVITKIMFSFLYWLVLQNA